MSKRNLLLLSSSKVGNTPYLSHALSLIKQRLGNLTNIVFVPYAGVSITYDEYTKKVNEALTPAGITVQGLHTFNDENSAINNADAIIVGGGNTFELLNKLYELNLVTCIQQCIKNGLHYIGWSAGANIAGMSIKTTNDMPIVQPESFNALSLVNCQLNPHYSDYSPPGFNGETRDQRLAEFMIVEPNALIIGLIEGTGLMITNEEYEFVLGENIKEPLVLFQNGKKTKIDELPRSITL